MNEIQKIQAWESIKSEIGKIYDQKTRSVYYRALLAKASREWGFNPEDPTSDLKCAPELNDWEKEFTQDIQDTISYGIDVREEKRKKTLDETCACMRQFVIHGGSLSDIPEDIRTPYIEKLYVDALCWESQNLCQCADDLIRRIENESN